MPSTLTSDFHAVVEVSEDLLNRFLLRRYLTGEVPGYPTRISGNLPAPAVGSYAVGILFPSLTILDPTPAMSAGIRLVLPLTGSIVIAQSPFNFVGNIPLEGAELRVYAPLRVNNSRSGLVNIDFANAEFIAEVDNLPINDFLRLFVKANIEDLAKAELLASAISSFKISDSASATLDIRGAAPSASAAGFLALFMDIVPTLPHAHRPTVRFVNTHDDVAIAISAEGLNAKLDREVRTRFGQILPAPLPDDPDTTLNNLELTLHDGYIRIASSVSTDIFHIRSDVGFSGELHFYHEDGFKPHLESIETDLPGWLDAFNFIPWLGTWFWLVIKDAADTFVAGSGIGNGFADVSSTSLSGYPSFVSGIDITPDAMTIHRWLALSTFVGNRSSKELHVFNDYRWIDKMSARNFVRFEYYETALAEGYNGCRYCLRQLDTG